MRLTFPKSSKSHVAGFHTDIRIMADYIADGEYNHQTLKVMCNHNSGNRDMSPRELADNAKYGAVIPLMK
jgi:hypothetical protein